MTQNYNVTDLPELYSDELSQCMSQVYGRIHRVRNTSKIVFIILRKRHYTLQTICLKKEMGEQFTELSKLPKESNVILIGKLVKADVKSCYYKEYELCVTGFKLINTPTLDLPFDLDNANMSCEKPVTSNVGVLMDTRLNNRAYDLRTPFNKIISKVTTHFLMGVRNYLVSELDFTEIFTPKLLGTCTESGAEVFTVDYFDRKAYLAQSPQLYKQMAINSDEQRVFTVGAVFRAENSMTKRHQTEFTGLDLEMELSPPFNYHEVINVLWNVVYRGYRNVSDVCNKEIEGLHKLHDYTKPVIPSKPVILTYTEAVDLLKSGGFVQDPDADLGTTNEKNLGDIVKSKYATDLFVLTEYPYSARPFYTMKMDGLINGIVSTKSYDFIFRGREILSGAQREHRADVLEKQITEYGMNTENFSDYLDSFKYGSPPHGGGGFGLARIITLMLGLDNIRYATLFPRDPHHLTP